MKKLLFIAILAMLSFSLKAVNDIKLTAAMTSNLLALQSAEHDDEIILEYLYEMLQEAEENEDFSLCREIEKEIIKIESLSLASQANQAVLKLF